MTHWINRRNLLKAAGALAAPAATAKPHGKIELLAEGVVPFGPTPFILSPTPPAIPPQVLQAILAGVLQARIRITYPTGRKGNILAVHVYLAGPSDPLPLPAAPTTVPRPSRYLKTRWKNSSSLPRSAISSPPELSFRTE